MKKYIERTDKGIECNHPQVQRFWLWGGGGRNEYVFFNVTAHATAIFNNGEVKQFDSKNNGEDLIDKANEYLNTIPENEFTA